MTIKQVDNKLVDELSKMNSSFALDMNLERSRAKEDVNSINNNIITISFEFYHLLASQPVEGGAGVDKSYSNRNC